MSFFGSRSTPSEEATQLRVRVVRNDETVVDVALPAKSARWLIDLIPEDVVEKIRLEQIPLDEIQQQLKDATHLLPQKIFNLDEPNRIVMVWLE